MIAVVPASSASSAPEPRGRADQLEVEGPVEPPPHELEDLGERRRRPRRRRHAARQRGVEVVVRVDQPGRRLAAAHARRIGSDAPLAVEVVQGRGDRARGRHEPISPTPLMP